VEIRAAGAACLQCSPVKSTRKPSELGVPWSTIPRPQEDRLGGEAVPVYVLSDDDSCPALSDTFPRFFPVTNVPSLAVRAKEIWRSGQSRIPVSRRRWTIMQRMVVDMGGYDVRLSDWILLDAALWGTHTFHSF
jgi:hypothetical protein